MNKSFILITIFVLCVFALCLGVYYSENIKPDATTEAYSVTVDDYNNLVDRYNSLADAYNTMLHDPAQVEIVEATPIVKTINSARCFETRAELLEWLALDDTDKNLYIKYYYNCQHFSRDLQRAALDDGYLINIELSDDRTHVLNTAYILSSHCMYYIEPQTDAVWLMGVMIED